MPDNIMADDHRRRVVAQRPPHHLARMHLGAVDGAAEEFLEGQGAMAGVQEQRGEHFAGIVSFPVKQTFQK